MNKAQELYNLASGASKELRTKNYFEYLLDLFEEQAEKGIFEDCVYFSLIKGNNVDRDDLIKMLKIHGFEVISNYEDNCLEISWFNPL